MKRSNKIITVQDVDITISIINDDDYICITDFAVVKDKGSRAADVIRNWLRNRNTLDFLSTWEVLYNKDFKVFESEHFRKQVGLLTFTPSVSEWVDKTNAKGLYVKKVNMVALMLIKILLLNLHLPLVLFSNYI